MPNSALEVILERRSCRSFTGEPLREGDLETLIEAMRRAPSAGNRQPWFFYIVRNPQVKRRLVEAAFGQSFLADAPVVFVACAESEISACRYGERGRRLYSIQDVAAAVENLLIAATEMGYGTCWVGAFEEETVQEIICPPGYRRPVAIIPVGPGTFNAPRTERRPIEKTFEFID